MVNQKAIWKKGRGKLGLLNPLIGKWMAEGDSPMGRVKCTREFNWILGGKYVELQASWVFSQSSYEEVAIIGIKDDVLTFWSFTSDGKNSTGSLSDASDIHPQAIGFEAQMPAGLARMVYWPVDNNSFYWAVESKNKKGWNRFISHHYKAVGR